MLPVSVGVTNNVLVLTGAVLAVGVVYHCAVPVAAAVKVAVPPEHKLMLVTAGADGGPEQVEVQVMLMSNPE